MATMDVSTTVLRSDVDYLPPPDPKAVEQAMLIGDISQMTDAQRIAYYVATCRSLHLNPLTKPFQALKGDDGKITLYPDKGCAEQLRKLHKVSVKVVGREFLDDLYIVTVRATTPDGREEEAQGVVPISKPRGAWKEYEYKGQPRRRFEPEIDSQGQEVMVPMTGADRAAALMRCETKAKRRATLAICGLGLPDWDPDLTSSAHPMALDLHSTPVIESAKDLTEHIADLYGDPVAPPPGEDVALDQSRLQAAIAAQPGWTVDAWLKWAEGRLKKPRTTFTVEDYQFILARVEKEKAKLKAKAEAQHKPTEAQGSSGEAPSTQQESTASPDTQEGTAGASWGPENPELFKQEERADEYGA
jgi:hypothetical protein